MHLSHSSRVGQLVTLYCMCGPFVFCVPLHSRLNGALSIILSNVPASCLLARAAARGGGGGGGSSMYGRSTLVSNRISPWGHSGISLPTRLCRTRPSTFSQKRRPPIVSQQSTIESVRMKNNNMKTHIPKRKRRKYRTPNGTFIYTYPAWYSVYV